MILERFPVVGPDDQDLGLVLEKFVIILTQLREMLAAVRSGKAAIEHKHNILFSTIVRQAHRLIVYIDELEIRS